MNQFIINYYFNAMVLHIIVIEDEYQLAYNMYNMFMIITIIIELC